MIYLKRFILILMLQALGAASFSQSLSLTKLGSPFSSPDMQVLWRPVNEYPHSVAIYRVLPRAFPTSAISNLVAQCGFSDKDKVKSNQDETVYKSAGPIPTKQLQITKGGIFYNNVAHYNSTNLASDVPSMREMPKKIERFLTDFGINIADLEKKSDGEPDFHFWEPFKEYFTRNGIITNVEFRAVGFSRVVDGARVIGAGTVGDGEVYFGPHAIPVHIDFSWRDLQKVRTSKTASPQEIIARIKNGKAVHGGVSMNAPEIDWKSVKSLTIQSADLCYYAGDRFAPSEWLMPLVSFWAEVDTGESKIGLEIDCPVLANGEP